MVRYFYLFTLALALSGLTLTGCESNQAPPATGKLPPTGFIDDDGGSADLGLAALPDLQPLPDGPLPDAAPERDAAAFEQNPFAVETRVGERHTVAGLENRFTCEVLDQQGAPIAGLRTVVEVHPDRGFERTRVGAIGQVARDYRILCAAPDLGLRDGTPADWTVSPASPVRTVATVSPDLVDVGDFVTAGCLAFDTFGNARPDDLLSVTFMPPVPELRVIAGEPFRPMRAGTFDVTCDVPGGELRQPAPLTVRPGLPARLDLRLAPDRRVFRVGAVVALEAVAVDAWDNVVDEVNLLRTADPALPTFGEDRFRLARDGRYTLTVAVDGPTHNNRVLTDSVQILVDFGGPGIECEDPLEGEYIVIPEGAHHRLRGTVADVAGLASVRVDGEGARLEADGTFASEVPVRWGLNVHEVVAIDEGGNESSALCTYFAADAYLDEAAPLVDALLLRLGQGAVDDGEPDNPLTSLADVLRRIVNSPGLRDSVHQAASAQNPIVPNECRASVLGLCLFSLGVDYTDLQIGGRNTLELPLVQGGLTARASIQNLAVAARLRGTLGNSARITTDHISIELTFDVGLRGDGQPDVRLRGVNEVDVGRLDSDFSGFITGAILELVFSAFEGLIRRTVTDAIRGFLQDNLAVALRDLLANMDLGALSQGFDVPSPTGGESIRLSLSPRLSTIDFAVGRALLGLSTKVIGPRRLAGESPGVPLPPGPLRVALPEDRTLGASVSLAVVNQVLHTLWRGGYFEAESGGLVGEVAGELPEGTEVFLSMPTAPAVMGQDDAGGATVRIYLGPARAGVIHPDIFAEPFGVEVSAALDANVRLVGERDLVFDQVRIVELHLDLAGAIVPQASRVVLEATLSRVLQGLMDRALNDGLPSLPLPEFFIPDSLGSFGLPIGAAIGLRQPRLTSTLSHWILDGNFRQ